MFKILSKRILGIKFDTSKFSESFTIDTSQILGLQNNSLVF